MDAQGAAPAARDVDQPAAERDVLRRPVAGRTGEHASRARVVDEQLVAIAGRHPHVTAVGCDADVVRKEVRTQPSDESRPFRT